MVIYANHLLRSSYLSMLETAKSILKNKRAKESEKNIISIKKNYRINRMIKIESLFSYLKKKNITFFTGVPDSILRI